MARVRVPLRRPGHGIGPSPMVRASKRDLAEHGETHACSQGPDPHCVSLANSL